MEEEQKKSGRGKIIATAVAILLLIAAALQLCGCCAIRKRISPLWPPAGLLEARNGAVYVADQGQNNIIRIDGDKRTLVAGYTLPADTHGKATGGHRTVPGTKRCLTGPLPWWSGRTESRSAIPVIHCIRFIEDETTVKTLAGTGTPGLPERLRRRGHLQRTEGPGCGQ